MPMTPSYPLQELRFLGFTDAEHWRMLNAFSPIIENEEAAIEGPCWRNVMNELLLSKLMNVN